jgi:hypothetical protein
MDAPADRLSLDREEWAELKRRITAGRPYSDRISIGFLCRLLLLHQTNGDELHVLSAIDQLEGLSSGCRTKRPRRFRGEVLGRFWHKHFATSRHVLRNFGDWWGLGADGNAKLDTVINDVAERFGRQPDLWPGVLVHELVLGGYEKRAGARKLTGDWIIYGRHHGRNYYLETASHLEAAEPLRLYEKLRGGSQAEFPFLFDGSA